MHRLKRILFDQYDLEIYYSGDNPSRVVPVYEFGTDEELWILATHQSRNWEYHDDSKTQIDYYISDNDIQIIEPIDISNEPYILPRYGKDSTDKGSS
jgi:hypothetical protein